MEKDRRESVESVAAVSSEVDAAVSSEVDAAGLSEVDAAVSSEVDAAGLSEVHAAGLSEVHAAGFSEVDAKGGSVDSLSASASSAQLHGNVEPLEAPTLREADRYDMTHAERGKAIIFNQFSFPEQNDLNDRKGSDEDRDRLQNVLSRLGFLVSVYNDQTRRQIRDILENVSLEDHSSRDCLLVCMMTHGEDGDRLHAYDMTIKSEELWKYFTAENCPSLAGKPKIIIIQACRGTETDDGLRVKERRPERFPSMTETDAATNDTYKIPNHADFLFAYASYPGHFSFRKENESWFIQALCDVLMQESAKTDVLRMLTVVNRRVALDNESFDPDRRALHQKKQTPTVTYTLTRDLYLTSPRRRSSVMN